MFFLGTKIDSFSKINDVRLTAPNRFFSSIFGMTQMKSMHKKSIKLQGETVERRGMEMWRWRWGYLSLSYALIGIAIHIIFFVFF